ncbi:MAG: phosphate ABC transporter permease subunit PstC [Clostridia bacterium]|nr:phosphate ABC transporter permease subunit PstC [Clostridia bacterium]
MNYAKGKEKAGKIAFMAMAIVCIVAVVAIFVFLTVRSIPAFRKIGFFEFLFGDNWASDRYDVYKDPLSGSYGIFTMIVGTLAATVGALLLGGVTGYFTAVFLAFFCPKRLKKPLSAVINLLAGIPSVVYGFFGIVFLLPILSTFAPNNGTGLLATSVILGIMILPTVVSLSKTSLEAVPLAYYEGATALGATHTKAVFSVMVPAARSGIAASLILGIGRALGETMAVVMVAGNAPTYPTGLFGSFRVLTANIVMEMGYAGEVQEDALIATGVVLLLFVLLVNLAFQAISGKAVEKITRKTAGKGRRNVLKEMRENLSYPLHLPEVGKGLAWACGIFSAVALLSILGFLFWKGVPTLIQKPSLLFGKYEFGSEDVTILPSIVSTLMVVALSLLIAVPVGCMTAIFLNEYTRNDSVFVKIVRTAIDILAGVPSIVYGLFGMITFVRIFTGASNLFAGSLTVSIMLLPTIVRSTEESLKSVQAGLREGSLALGAGKLRTILCVVLPSALPGILSAMILSMGRVISESAPFLYTAGSVLSGMPKGYFDSGATLAVALYRLSGEGWYMQEAYATAVILIVIVLALNFLAEGISSALEKRIKGENNGKKTR